MLLCSCAKESETTADGESKSDVGAAMQIRLPLNSKRLTKSHLRRLANQLDVPTGASADEIRQMIDGKLSEAGRNAMNIQVVLVTAHPDSKFSLEDEEGKFLTVQAGDVEDDDSPQSEYSESGDDTNVELDSLKEENRALHDQVSHLETKLEDEKTRFRELWRTNRRCLAEYDALISAKDKKIEELQRQLREQAEISPPSGSVESVHHFPPEGGM